MDCPDRVVEMVQSVRAIRSVEVAAGKRLGQSFTVHGECPDRRRNPGLVQKNVVTRGKRVRAQRSERSRTHIQDVYHRASTVENRIDETGIGGTGRKARNSVVRSQPIPPELDFLRQGTAPDVMCGRQPRIVPPFIDLSAGICWVQRCLVSLSQ